jgi:hypothetical protein
MKEFMKEVKRIRKVTLDELDLEMNLRLRTVRGFLL